MEFFIGFIIFSRSQPRATNAFVRRCANSARKMAQVPKEVLMVLYVLLPFQDCRVFAKDF